MAKKITEKPKKICQPLVIFKCKENHRRLTKLEYLVLLIIKDFGNIQLQDKESKEYYWPDMAECVSHYLKTEKFDEVLEVVMDELFRKKLLQTDVADTGDYIHLKLNEVHIADTFDGSIVYDKFHLTHKCYKLVEDKGELHFRAVAESRLPEIEPCKKHKGKNCLGLSLDNIIQAFREYLGRIYPGYKDDIIIEPYVLPVMVDFDEEKFQEFTEQNAADNVAVGSPQKYDFLYCIE